VGLTAAALAALLGACSASFSTGGSEKLSAEEVAKEAKKQLDPVVEKQGHPPLPAVTCPHDLDKKKGASMRCEANGSFGDSLEGTLGITATVSSVHGDTADLRFVTDKKVR